MSIIERAAALLGSDALAQLRLPASRRGTDALGQEPERAAEDAADPHASLPGESGERSAASRKPVRPATATPRRFKVDRDLLRRQGLITPDGERSALAESFRRVKRQILGNVARWKSGAPPANLVMVTSAREGEGKTFCAINLAISVALEVDRSVLLVDADVSRARVMRAFGLDANRGLMELLLDPQVDVADVAWQTDIGGLLLLPVGTADRRATELLASDIMRGLLRDLADRHPDRIIVFDSPPLLAASEAGALASQVGQIVLVVEAGRTSESVLKDALGRVDASRIAGLILNKVEGPRLEYDYETYG